LKKETQQESRRLWRHFRCVKKQYACL